MPAPETNVPGSGKKIAVEGATGWSRFLLPSIRDLVFLLCFWSLLMGPLANRPLADADIGWHIRTGEQILAGHAIPRTDAYSSLMHGQPWYAWEWLYDVLLGAVHHAIGLSGVVWLAAFLMSTTFTLLLGRMLWTGTGLPLALPLWLLALWASSIHAFARPHIASWLFTLGWFIALDEWERHGTRPWFPWFFPASMALWVNLHGAWPLGLLLVGVFAMSAAVESVRGKDDVGRIRDWNRAKAMSWTLALSGAATVLNPYGIDLHKHIVHYLSDPFLMNRIAEFRSPDFHGWGQRAFVSILLLTLLAFGTRRLRMPVSRWLLVPLLAYAGSYAARNVPIAAQLLVLIIGPLLWEGILEVGGRPTAVHWVRKLVVRGAALASRAREQEFHFKGHLWPWMGVVVSMILCANKVIPGFEQPAGASFDAKHLPVQAVEFLKAEPSLEPVFGPDQWGGYLIYRLYPQRQVVIDDRHDLYGSQRFREYDALVQGAPGWQLVLDRWGIRTIVMQTDSTLANLLREQPRAWKTIYEDQVAVVMERNAGVDAGVVVSGEQTKH